VYVDAYMIPICSYVWYLCCILKLYQIVVQLKLPLLPLLPWFSCALKIIFGAKISEHLCTTRHRYVGAVSNLIHYIIYYHIIPLLLDILLDISHYQYPQSWDDHLNMNGMFKSYNPIKKSHDFTMILHQLLVGGFNHLEKYDFVNGKDDIPYIMEHKKWLKPPTRLVRCFLQLPYGFPYGFPFTKHAWRVRPARPPLRLAVDLRPDVVTAELRRQAELWRQRLVPPAVCWNWGRSNIQKLVGGFKHFLFSIIYGIILPIDFHIFQDG
jgi:hypothetical protein